jgi:hypothetical protein
MARAVLGGLLSSSLITLVFVPVVYFLFKSRFGKRRGVAAGREREAAGMEVQGNA